MGRKRKRVDHSTVRPPLRTVAQPCYRYDDARLGVPLPHGVVHLVVTSPPYFGRWRYTEAPVELGLGQSLSQYVGDTVRWMAELRPLLALHGQVFLNIGDTRTGTGGAGGDFTATEGLYSGQKGYRVTKAQWEGLEDRQNGLVPERVALALQDDGWNVNRIVWAKGRIRRGDNTPQRNLRGGEAYEMIYVLRRNEDLRLTPEGKRHAPSAKWFAWNAGADGYEWLPRSDVWEIFPSGGTSGTVNESGTRPFTSELVDTMICMGSRPGQLVLDPFGGTAEAAAVAVARGRLGLAFDVNGSAEWPGWGDWAHRVEPF
jgi:DNA modification methylase